MNTTTPKSHTIVKVLAVVLIIVMGLITYSYVKNGDDTAAPAQQSGPTP